jgi:hypothetical protein
LQSKHILDIKKEKTTLELSSSFIFLRDKKKFRTTFQVYQFIRGQILSMYIQYATLHVLYVYKTAAKQGNTHFSQSAYFYPHNNFSEQCMKGGLSLLNANFRHKMRKLPAEPTRTSALKGPSSKIGISQIGSSDPWSRH